MSPDTPRGLAGRGPARHIRVLIVEDFATDADLMVRYLRRSGIVPEVRVVQEEGPFRAALQDFRPDVVLLDNSLPRFSGRHALRFALRHDPLVPVIMVTGTLDERRLLRLMRVGLADYVVKDDLKALGISVIHAVEQARVRRQAQRDREALAASERRFRAVAEGAGDAVIIGDAAGTILYCNEAVHRIFGYEASELVGRHGSILTGSGQERNVADFLGDTLQGEVEVTQGRSGVGPVEMSLLHKSGTPLPVEVSLSLWHEGSERMFAAHVRDLSSRRRTEQERKLLARAVEQARNAVLITDVDGRLQYVNPAFEQMTGYSRDEVVGQNPRILKSGRHDSGFYAEMWRRLKSGETFQAEFTNRRKDGAEYRQRSIVFPIADDTGTTVSYVGIAQDVTRERSLEEQFRQAQKMEAVGQLAGGIAHDFNNVLTGILGNAELLSDSVDAPQAREHVDDIVKGAARGADLVRRLMSLSREDSGERRSVSVATSVDEAVRTIRRMLPEHIDVAVRHAPESNGVRAEVDEGALHQALMNLATNARDAMPDGGRLELRTGLRGDRVVVGVVDSGTGMPTQVVDRLFDPFFTTKERGKGTGLGMVMVLQFAESHGGAVEVASTPGEGTRVDIVLPQELAGEPPGSEPATGAAAAVPSRGGVVSAPPPEVAREGPGAAARYAAGTVLLAEDQRQVAEVAKRALERMGLKVLMAADGAEALQMLRTHTGEVELVITDLVMPRRRWRERRTCSRRCPSCRSRGASPNSGRWWRSCWVEIPHDSPRSADPWGVEVTHRERRACDGTAHGSHAKRRSVRCGLRIRRGDPYHMYRILLVDDEDGVRALMAGFLRRKGHEVVEATSGRAALRLLETELVDVVVSDINMPDVDGLEVIRGVRRLQPGLPVVAVTGGGMMPGGVLLKTAQAMGAMRTLAKPFGLTELLDSVEGVVQEATEVR